MDNQLQQAFDTIFSGPVITVTRKEAKEGCTKHEAIKSNSVCKTCNGTGDIDGDDKHFCEKCEGSGRVAKTKKFLGITFADVGACEHCGGIGRIVENPCKDCNGSGKETMLLEVQIPAGTKPNDHILLNTSELLGKETYITVKIV